MRRSLFLRVFLLALLLPGVLAMLSRSGWSQEFGRGTVVIDTASGAQLRFNVEVARTPEQSARGLMFRQGMADDAGMIFLYDMPQATAFWMKNTLIPLDMLFVSPDRRIINIHPEATPLSEAPIRSKGPVIAVLEINGGLAARLGIRPGDKVSWK